MFNIGHNGMFPKRYLENEWSEDTTYVHLFDAESGDLLIEGVFRYGFHRDLRS